MTDDKTKLLDVLGKRYNLDGKKLYEVLTNTIFRQRDGSTATPEQMATICAVASRYNLDPMCKEIYAYPDKGGGVIPVVGVDGWVKMAQNHPDYEGVTFRYSDEMVRMPGAKVDGHVWIEAIIRRKGMVPFEVREYLDEVYRPANRFPGPWQTHTKRFHRHKAFIQAARMAFGFSGIYDPDEASRIRDAAPVSDDEMKYGYNDAIEGQVEGSASNVTQEQKDRLQGTLDKLIEKAQSKGTWDATRQWAKDNPTINANPHLLAYIIGRLDEAQEEARLSALEQEVEEADSTVIGDKDSAPDATDAKAASRPDAQQPDQSRKKPAD